MLFCYIVRHYYLAFDRGEVHIFVVVILLISTAYGFTEKWFMLWLVILSTITV